MSAIQTTRRALIVFALSFIGSASLSAAQSDHHDDPWSAAVRIASPLGTVTSTFRTVAHNRAVGGVADSYHLLGQAIDVVRKPGVSHARLAAALRAGGLSLIESLDEGNHSHFAFGVIARKANVIALVPPPVPHARLRTDFLAADRHGTLRIDVGRAVQSSRVAMQAGTPGSSGSR